MKELYFVRHGETEYNKNSQLQGRGVNISLNEKGKNQAVKISEYFTDKPVSKIVTSSLKRAIESAEPIASQKKLKLNCYPELDEMSFGDLEGKVFQSVKKEIQFLVEQWKGNKTDVAPKNGESPKEVFDRANIKVIELLNSSDEDVIVFMIHGRLIRILLSEWLGLGLARMQDIAHTNGAINHLMWENGVFSAVELNITDHLK